MEEKIKSDIPTFSQSWTPTQRFNVAAFSVQLVHDYVWSTKDEKEWKQRFLISVFQHLGIEDKKEQKVLLRMPIDNKDDSEVVNILFKVFKESLVSDKDIREEIISDFLFISLGLTRNICGGDDESEKPPPPNNHIHNHFNSLKENINLKLGTIISNIKQDDDNISTTSTDSSDSLSLSSLQPMDKPAEYDARARAIVFKLGHYLDIPIANSSLNKHAKRLTGGLATPFVAAGISAITGAGIIAAVASNVAIMASLFGIAGGGLGGYKMHKRMQGLKALSFIRIIKDDTIPIIPSLHVNIVISGYLLEDVEETTSPWIPTFQNTSEYRDTFALSFDPEILLGLGKAFRQFLAESAVRVAANSAIQHTVLATLATALFIPAGLMKACDLIDNPWALGVDRARKAGLVLADILIERVQGKRPTVGYSLGALVIWHCLQQLVKLEQYGLVDTVVLIGAPIASKPIQKWKDATTVVARRFVNAYATNDIVLGLIYRMHSLDLDVAGLGPINNCLRIENYNITEFTSGHLGYKDPVTLTGILKKIDLEN
ncbi:18920_t:CDS:2 [Entrophospora sp. SA101]|nr:18920_t:CDS:2 [Entrophospora sp. SA101]CAJ0831824.1 10563_t:CDS:2 [Entrophospora sp. SA101]CAJ0927273.1 17036_t:CDS:2 [Entrophospora sp. SA101]